MFYYSFTRFTILLLCFSRCYYNFIIFFTRIENSKFYSNHEINKILNIENLNKNFNLPGSNEPLKAVNDLSFSLNEGEIFGIAGESGSGLALSNPQMPSSR